MCLFTVYVHDCGHFATGPISTYPCFWDCDPVTDVSVLRDDFGWPYPLRPELEVVYINLESTCLDCMPRADPYADIEVPGAEDLVWHVPYVSCDEDLFRDIDWSPDSESHDRSQVKVSQHESEVGYVFDQCDGRSTSITLPNQEAPIFMPMQPSFESTLEQHQLASHTTTSSSSFWTAHSHMSGHSYVRERPHPLLAQAVYHPNSSPPLPELRPVEARRHDQIARRISEELDFAIHENEQYLARARHEFEQSIRYVLPDLPLAPHPYDNPHLLPQPLTLSGAANHPYGTTTVNWTSRWERHSTGLLPYIQEDDLRLYPSTTVGEVLHDADDEDMSIDSGSTTMSISDHEGEREGEEGEDFNINENLFDYLDFDIDDMDIDYP